MTKNNTVLFLFLVLCALFPETGYTQYQNALRLIGPEHLPVEKGQPEVEYSFTYSQTDSEDLLADPNRVEDTTETRSTHELYLSYGLLNRLSIHGAIPYEYRKTEISNSTDKSENGIGDMALGLTWELIEPDSKLPSTLFHLSYKTTTGSSPYDTNGDELPTGSGYPSLKASLALNKPIQRVIPFLTLSYSYNFDVDGLSYQPNPTDGESYIWMTDVEPGDVMEIGTGASFILSDNSSLFMRFNMKKQFDSTYIWHNRTNFTEPEETSRMIHLGAGFQFYPHLSLFPELRIGLTDDDPDYEFVLRVAF